VRQKVLEEVLHLLHCLLHLHLPQVLLLLLHCRLHRLGEALC
jgi:hypothetical protein